MLVGVSDNDKCVNDSCVSCSCVRGSKNCETVSVWSARLSDHPRFLPHPHTPHPHPQNYPPHRRRLHLPLSRPCRQPCPSRVVSGYSSHSECFSCQSLIGLFACCTVSQCNFWLEDDENFTRSFTKITVPFVRFVCLGGITAVSRLSSPRVPSKKKSFS